MNSPTFETELERFRALTGVQGKHPSDALHLLDEKHRDEVEGHLRQGNVIYDYIQHFRTYEELFRRQFTIHLQIERIVADLPQADVQRFATACQLTGIPWREVEAIVRHGGEKPHDVGFVFPKITAGVTDILQFLTDCGIKVDDDVSATLPPSPVRVVAINSYYTHTKMGSQNPVIPREEMYEQLERDGGAGFLHADEALRFLLRKFFSSSISAGNPDFLPHFLSEKSRPEMVAELSDRLTRDRRDSRTWHPDRFRSEFPQNAVGSGLVPFLEDIRRGDMPMNEGLRFGTMVDVESPDKAYWMTSPLLAQGACEVESLQVH